VERPTFRQLEYAVAVADHGSFSRAAEALFVSQPGLSAQIAELERRLEFVLFERNRSSCIATSAGEEVITRARMLLLQADELTHASAAHRGAVVGAIRIGAIPTIAPYLFSTLARTLRTSWPEAHLELHELRTADLIGEIAQGRIDFGLLATPAQTRSLEVSELLFEPFVLALAESNPLNTTKLVTETDLSELELLLLEDGHCLRDHILDVCRIANATNSRGVHQTSLAVLSQMTASSSAATLLPACAVEVEARAGSGLAIRELADPTWGRTLSLVWRTTDPRAPLFRQATSLVADALAARIRSRPLTP
jgi:LysR family hydrogen peroxide-inducible transcriptional activator